MESYPWIATNTSWCSIKANGKSNITGATRILMTLRPMPSEAQLMRRTPRIEKAVTGRSLPATGLSGVSREMEG
jgi:hypothetical protein